MPRLRQHAPDTLARYDRAGTIGDYVAAWLLAGRDAHYIDTINAAAWGLLDTTDNKWSETVLSALQVT